MISWHLSGKADVTLVVTTFQKACESRNTPYGLMLHSPTVEHSIRHLHSVSFWIL